MSIELTIQDIQSISNQVTDVSLKRMLEAYLQEVEFGEKIKFTYFFSKNSSCIKVYRYDRQLWKYRLINKLSCELNL